MNPTVVHIVRPYASEQDYLEAEAWSIDARSILLIDAAALPMETAVLFDVALQDGQKPIRAEGRVMGLIAPIDGRPGGLRVRFKRFGAATKAFIERAVKVKETRSSPSHAERPSQVELERPSQVELERLSMPEVRASMTDLEHLLTPLAPARDSGVRQRAAGPVAAPAHREELLARLRQRRHAG